jgi:hypothetical protein
MKFTPPQKNNRAEKSKVEKLHNNSGDCMTVFTGWEAQRRSRGVSANRQQS